MQKVAPARDILSRTELEKAYERMHFIRTAEEKIAAHYLANKVMSFVHFYTGQEAVAVGVADALKATDKMLGNHRSHGHYLAKGGDIRAMVCELLGKAAGSSKGKGGSMHMMDTKVGFVGSSPILGSVTPLSAGVAFAEKYNKRKTVVVGFIGDGASEEGSVYETYNLAALFKLPLLIVIENNLFAVNTALEDRRAKGYDTKKIVEALGARYEYADGNNYHDVRTKADALVASIREGNGPAVLECVAYRHRAHSAPIFDESCRKIDDEDTRKKEDSVAKLRAELLELGTDEKKLAKLEVSNAKLVDDAIAYAIAAPYPKKNTLHTDLYV